ncbi:MAG: toprim domain-containing protein [Verrucomicrobia bacterium]|nr:toprim domain-containing protein [Verrucomicrobiota bacterium]
MTLLDLYSQHTGCEPKKVATTGAGEWHGVCPACGGKDRFRIQPNNKGKRCIGFFACRQCKQLDGRDFCGDTISFCIDVMGMTPDQAYEAANAKRPEESFIKYSKGPSFVPTAITSPTDKWKAKATSFVNWAHEQIMKKPKALSALEMRGLPIEAVQKYKIGWCDNERVERGYFECKRIDWDLPEEVNDNGEIKPLYLPRGIVVPCLEKDGNVVRVKIRRTDWTPESEFPKYKAIPGSQNGLSIVGNTNNPVMIVVESELDAYAIDFSCGDFSFVIGVGSNSKNPDNVTHYLAKKKKTLLICRDNDDAGKSMFYKWRKLYMHACDYPTPFGKDIGEAIQEGLNIRKWLLDIINN